LSNADGDFADEHPDTEVIGIDITPTQSSWVPPNVKFEIEDAQLDWTFQPESFDFIHLRYMHGSFADWDKLFSEMYKALKPGGWFQHVEPDIEINSDHPDITIDEKQ
jgi:SAM-dependent methyltransferase